MRKWDQTSAIKERRGHRRSTVMLRARLITAAGEVRAYVRNISRSGAMIDANHDLAGGEAVKLLCGDYAMSAQVAWFDGARLGLAFVTELSEDELTDLIGKAQRRAA
jgi:hypothetical protein